MKDEFWLLSTLLSGSTWFIALPMTRSQGARKYLAWGVLLGGGWVLAIPLIRMAARVAVTWLYERGPASLARLLMPSRNLLPLSHYLARMEAGLKTVTGMVLLLVLGGTLYLVAISPRWQARWRHLTSQPAFRYILAALALPWLLAAGAFMGMEVAYRMPHPVFYTGCPKIWGHRGHPEPPDIPENTIASFQRAFDLGAPGVEMDVAYLREKRQFVIRRPDREYPQHLTLEEVFAAVGTRGYFWLDLKTIRELTPEEAQQAARDLRDLVDRFGLRDRVIVESEDPHNLRYFAREGLHTSYWIFNIDETEFPSSSWQLFWTLQKIRWHYIRGGFSAISMDRRFYTPQVARALKGARIHLFTVNDPATLRDLAQREEVRVILTDTDLYRLVECP